MANTGWLTETATGTYALTAAAGHPITGVDYEIGALTNQRILVPAAALGAYYKFAGSFGLATSFTDHASVSKEWVTFRWHCTDLHGTVFIPSGQYADTLWWVIPPGMTLYLRVGW